MADKKAERLINLTLALLATSRYLKKSEIFANVNGYSGNAESMDRMFERDKSELRDLGIDISVGDLDPFFDDEPGYRIFKDSYSFQLKNLDPADVGILSVAAKLWNDSVLGVDAQAGLLKLESLGISNDTNSNLTFDYRYEDPTANLTEIESAILEEKSIKFLYRDGNEIREVDPYRILLWNGFWYFIGLDKAKGEIRTFKVSRISGEVLQTKSKFKIPENFDVKAHIPVLDRFQVTLKIPEGKAVVLRNLGELVESDEGYDIYKLVFADAETGLREILRHGADVQILEPKSLISSYKSALEKLTNV
jgi:proteasome accessory factor B